MSGETQDSVSGWTVDTLHSFVETSFSERDTRFGQRFGLIEKQIDTAHEATLLFMQQRFKSIEERVELARQAHDLHTQAIQARMEDQIRAVDERHNAASRAQDVAVQAALMAVREAGNQALVAAQQAAQKAENANEKRFDSVNEFRAQLADQATHFMPRSEAQVLITNNTDKANQLTLAVAGIMQRTEVESLLRSIKEQHERDTAALSAELTVLRQHDTRRSGADAGSDRITNFIFVGIGTLVGLAGIVFGAIGLSR